MKLLFLAVAAVAGLWVLLAMLVRPQTWRAVVYGAAFVAGFSRHLYHVTKTREVRLREQRRHDATKEELPDANTLIEAVERNLKEHRCP